MADVAELRRSRRLMLLAVRGAWALLTVLFGAAATAILRTVARKDVPAKFFRSSPIPQVTDEYSGTLPDRHQWVVF